MAVATDKKAELDKEEADFVESYRDSVTKPDDASPEKPEKKVPTKEPEPEPVVEQSETPTEEEKPDFGPVAERYGVDPERLEAFRSIEDAERFLSSRDETLLEEGRRYQQDWQEQFRSQTPEPITEPEFDLSNYDQDDPVVKNFTSAQKLIKSQADRLAALEQTVLGVQHQQRTAAEEQARQDAAEAMDQFAKQHGVKIGRTQRQDILNDAYTMAWGQVAQGRPFSKGDWIRYVERSAYVTLRDDLGKAKQETKKKTIEERSKKRLGAPARTGATPDMEFDGPDEKHPYLHQLYDELFENQ